MPTSWSRAGSSRFLALCLSGVALTLACCALPSGADAQGLYYRSIPIGERAIGLGGAFTGIADDPSASYYNPAGLMSGGRFQLLGSLSSIVFTRQTIDDAFASPTLEDDFTSKTTTTLPHFIGTVVKFGKKKFGDYRYAVAYSSLEVDRSRFNAGSTQIEEEGSLDLRLGDNYTMRWWGVSFAMQASKKTSVGLTAFLSSQRGGYSEDIGIATGGTLQPSGNRLGGESITSTTSLGIDAWSIVFRLGALHRINPKWQIGFMFQPPSAPIKQKGSVYRRWVTNVDGAESNYFIYNEGDLAIDTPIPWELRTGVEYRINTLTVLSVDAAVTGRVRDRQVFSTPPELSGLDSRLGAYFSNSTERRWTPNVAIGAEHMFGKAVVAGGLFTNISAAPDVPDNATEYTPEQISMFGASLSVGIDTKGYRLTVGATGYFGRGDALAFTIDRDANLVGYRSTKSNRSALVLYIAGAVSVASKGAKEVQERYKEHKAAKKKGGDDEDPALEEPDAEGDPASDEPAASPDSTDGALPDADPAKPPSDTDSVE